jgi:BirA family transcriptional regulator, biotin operon repressor / biotin---[acetyl-CoA-carboxylase] ligase
MKFKKFKFKKVKSTNDTAIRLIKKNNCKSGMVVADTQLSGKGQYGRKWISYKGNLFVSFFHELNSTNLSISTITKINCLLLKKILSKYTKKKIFYKKPNDLLIDKKKISGILQEIISKSDKVFLITGIGINIAKNPNIKNYPTTNMRELTNKTVSKAKVENNLKQLFEKNLSRIYKIKSKNK